LDKPVLRFGSFPKDLSFLDQVDLYVQFFHEIFHHDEVMQIAGKAVRLLNKHNAHVPIPAQEIEHFVEVLASLLLCALGEFEFLDNKEGVGGCIAPIRVHLGLKRESQLLLLA